MNKLVSIITPSYNSEKYISDTINSVLKQNYENWEMIIVDDCSSDNSIAVISMFISKDKTKASGNPSSMRTDLPHKCYSVGCNNYCCNGQESNVHSRRHPFLIFDHK